MALLEKAAGQGHAYAMNFLGCVHYERKEHEQALEWFTMGAEAGLPIAMFNLGQSLQDGEGVAAPDNPAAVGWYKRAAEAGNGDAAANLSNIYTIGRAGVTRSKRRAMQWMRKAAENGDAQNCLTLARTIH